MKRRRKGMRRILAVAMALVLMGGGVEWSALQVVAAGMNEPGLAEDGDNADIKTIEMEPQVEYIELPQLETTSMPMMMFALGTDENVPLRSGNYAKWIDRLDLTEADYAMTFYNWLAENSDNDGSEDALINPVANGTTVKMADDSLYYLLREFTGTVNFTYEADATQEQIEDSASEAVNEILAGKADEVSKYAIAVFSAFDRDYPQVFWLSGNSYVMSQKGFGYSYQTGGTTGTATYSLTVGFLLKDSSFDIRGEAYADMETSMLVSLIEEVDEKANTIVSGAASEDTNYDKVQYFNEWLTTNNCYNSNLNTAGNDTHESISALMGKTGTEGPVCEGYARAFKVLCDKANIPCVLVSGNAGNKNETPEAHMWNYVQLEGKWYAVDVTWNDPVVTGITSAESGYERVNYSLVGSNTLIEGMTFSESHIMTNTITMNGVAFTNEPVIETMAYVPSQPCTHTTFDANGKCSCGIQAEAKMGDTFYLTLAAAATQATEGVTIQVFTDVNIEEEESLAFADYATLEVAEGKNITCEGTVTIGGEEGVIFENQLYYYGGDVTNTHVNNNERNQYFKAGNGYIISYRDSNTNTDILKLYNASVTSSDGLATIGSVYYDVHIQFFGINTITDASMNAPVTIYLVDAGAGKKLTLSGEENAVLNIIAADAESGYSYGIRCDSLTINGGTVNITAGDGESSHGIAAYSTVTVTEGILNVSSGNAPEGTSCCIEGELIVGEGATVNLTVGKAIVLFGAFIVSNEGTVNGLSIVPADNVVNMAYVVSGNTTLVADFSASIEDLRLPFSVPTDTYLTVNNGVTLDLSAHSVADIDFSGTVINKGILKLPAAYELDNAPKSGVVKIGEKSYSWDEDNNSWICGDEASHARTYSSEGSDIIVSCEYCEEVLGTATVNVENKTYDGTGITASVDKTGVLVGESINITYKVKDGENLDAAPVNAGSYTVFITLGEGNDVVTASRDFTIAKTDATVVVAPIANENTYNGTLQALLSAGTAQGGEMQYSLDGTTWGTTIPAAKNAGVYTVYYQVIGDMNHLNVGPQTIEVTIAPKDIEGADISYNESFIYDGTAKEPDSIAVELNGRYLMESDYEISGYSDNINAGTATITIAGKGNYTGTATDTFTISKATAPAMTVPAATAITYGQTLSEAILSDGWNWVDGTVMPDSSDMFAAEMTVDGNNYDYTGVVGYDGAAQKVVRDVSVVVNKAPLTVTAKDYTIRVGQTLPVFEYDVTGLVTGDAFPGNVTISCAVTDSNAAGSYTITVSGPESTDNYAIAYVSGTLNISEKDIQVVTVGDVTLTYGDTDKKITATTSGDGAFSYRVATGTDVISVAADGTITALKAGTATVVVTAAETADYATVAKTITVTVNKATPIIVDAPTVEGREYNPSLTLEDGDLTGGTVSGVEGSTLEGTWSFAGVSGIVPDAGEWSYEAVFTPTDANYTAVTCKVNVSVYAANLTIASVETIDRVYDGTGDVEITAVILDGILGGDMVSVQFPASGTLSGLLESPAAGVYTRVQIAEDIVLTGEDAGNYIVILAQYESTNVTISKADAYTVGDKKQSYIYSVGSDGKEEVNIAGLLKNDSGSVTYILTEANVSFVKEQSVSTDGVLSYVVDTSGKAGDVATITVTATSQNYKDVTVKVIIMVEKAPIAADKVQPALDAILKPVANGELPDMVNVANDSGYSVAISWTPNDEKAGFNTVYTAKAYFTADANHLFAQGIMLEGWEVVSNSGAVLVAKRTFDATRKAEIVGITSPKVTTLTKYYDKAADAIAELPTTVKVEVEGSENDIAMPVTWKCDAYVTSPNAVNIFVWTVKAEAYAAYDAGNVDVSGRVAITNSAELPAVTPTPTPEATATPVPTGTPTATPTGTPTATPTGTPTATPTGTPTATPTGTPTAIPTAEPTATPASPSNPAPTVTDSGKPFIQDENGKIGWVVIEDELEKASAGETVRVNMNGATVVPGYIFDEIKGQDITITLLMDNGVSWTVNGKDVTTKSAKDIDLAVTVGTETNPVNNIPVQVLNKVTGEKYHVNISLKHNGELGMKAILNINLDPKNEGFFANLFYYNATRNSMQFVWADDIDANGMAHLVFEHASEYSIVIDKEIMQKSATAVQTGDNSVSPVILIVIMLVSLLAATGIFLYLYKGKRSNRRGRLQE